MRKVLKKLNILLLCIAVLLIGAAPAFAESAEDYAILNLRVEIDEWQIEGMTYDVYYIADLDGVGAYSDIVSAETLKSSQVQAGDQVEAVNSLAEVINADGARDSVISQETYADGIARFTGLADGYYLVASGQILRQGDTTYTPIPFVVRIPYEVEGVVNNHLTATIKFVEEIDIPEDDVPLADVTPEPEPEPEPEAGEEGSGGGLIDMKNLDERFEEAARLIVST